MKFISEYTHVIAIAEMADGNESVGTMWLETKRFDKYTPIDKILAWANNTGTCGKLIITIDESSEGE